MNQINKSLFQISISFLSVYKVKICHTKKTGPEEKLNHALMIMEM